jgi:type III restriction enzyme
MSTLQLQFDSALDYQNEAVRAVVDLFEGLPHQSTAFDFEGNVRPNYPSGYPLDELTLLTNLQYVQERIPTTIRPTTLNLEIDEGTGLDWTDLNSHRHPSFTVEMETGTGKTYVYLRTIHELHREVGFRKFIIVVPSIAIYEGVVKTFQITRTHFAALYGNPTVHLTRFEGDRLSALRTFADSSFIEIMVMTLDSFNKKSNKIYKRTEQLPGEWLPYQYIQAARPILILDEPQNMGSDLAKQAIRTLRPLFSLRYSATHRESPNLLYRLTPFEAFRRGLVKRIEVHGVTTQDYLGSAGFALLDITKKPITARVRVSLIEKGAAVEKELSLSQGHDLYERTKHPAYQSYGRVSEIHAGQGFIEFSGGQKFSRDDAFGAFKRDIFRVQIETTVATHMARQQELAARGIKVLSLFFIDRVANYINDTGLIRTLFEQAYAKHAPHYPHFAAKSVTSVHSGYFAQRKTKSGASEAVDTTSRNDDERTLEKAAFALIMQDKERLLSLDEDVSFIFAHSALKEGWDNPNVFQICTLNQTTSEPKKRQEIGRGLRIPVNQSGVRVFDEDVARLTVVANDSYEAYVSALQQDYREDGQADQPPAPSNASKRDAETHRRDALFQHAAFQEFWNRLAQRLDYRIHIDTDALIAECITRLNLQTFPEPRIVVTSGQFVQSQITLTLQRVTADGHAHLDIQIIDTRNKGKHITDIFAIGDSLADKCGDSRLADFIISDIQPAGSASALTFTNATVLTLEQPSAFSTETGQVVRQSTTTATLGPQPIFNLLERAATATNLTRRTILAIFKGLSDDRQRLFLRNPEVFAGRFIRTISQQVSRHIAQRIEFFVSNRTISHALEELFPPTTKFLQRELVEAGDNGVYDKMQTDSNIERNFVVGRLKDNAQVLLYFKFPAKYRIHFPRSIGNYNPDWGVLWRNADGRDVVSLVRETKGSEDIRLLQWEHEKRKIEVARRHFAALDIDYRTVTDRTGDWWAPGPDQLPLDDNETEAPTP